MSSPVAQARRRLERFRQRRQQQYQQVEGAMAEEPVREQLQQQPPPPLLPLSPDHPMPRSVPPPLPTPPSPQASRASLDLFPSLRALQTAAPQVLVRDPPPARAPSEVVVEARGGQAGPAGAEANGTAQSVHVSRSPLTPPLAASPSATDRSWRSSASERASVSPSGAAGSPTTRDAVARVLELCGRLLERFNSRMGSLASRRRPARSRAEFEAGAAEDVVFYRRLAYAALRELDAPAALLRQCSQSPAGDLFPLLVGAVHQRLSALQPAALPPPSTPPPRVPPASQPLPAAVGQRQAARAPEAGDAATAEARGTAATLAAADKAASGTVAMLASGMATAEASGRAAMPAPHEALALKEAMGGSTAVVRPLSEAASQLVDWTLGLSTEEEGGASDTDAVRVTVRVRPPSGDEVSRGEPECVVVEAAGGASRSREGEGESGGGVGSGGAGGEGGEWAPRRRPQQGLTVQQNDGSARKFAFQSILGPEASQADVFAAVGTSLVRDAWRGLNAGVVAYGQTGSGKSFTVLGPGPGTQVADPAEEGLLPRMARRLFAMCELARRRAHQHSVPFACAVELAFVEIYNEDLRDLLAVDGGAPQPALRLRELPHGEVVVLGLTWHAVAGWGEARALVEEALQLRAVACTDRNLSSSRSHAICMLRLTQAVTPHGAAGAAAAAGDAGVVRRVRRVATLYVVDLAGSESARDFAGVAASKSALAARAADQGKGRRAAALAGWGQERTRENAAINRSLLHLGRCISMLASGTAAAAAPAAPAGAGASAPMGGGGGGGGGVPTAPLSYVPYRGSTLTLLLRDCLGGNARLALVATVSPTARDRRTTLATLRYAEAAALASTRARVNQLDEQTTVAELRRLVDAARQAFLHRRHGADDGLGALLSPPHAAPVSARNARPDEDRASADDEAQAEDDEERKVGGRETPRTDGDEGDSQADEKHGERAEHSQHGEHAEDLENGERAEDLENGERAEDRQHGERAEDLEALDGDEDREEENGERAEDLEALEVAYLAATTPLSARRAATLERWRERRKALQRMGLALSRVDTEALADVPPLHVAPDPWRVEAEGVALGAAPQAPGTLVDDWSAASAKGSSPEPLASPLASPTWQLPQLVNLSDDALECGTLVIPLRPGVTRVGRADASRTQDVVLRGAAGIQAQHCLILHAPGPLKAGAAGSLAAEDAARVRRGTLLVRPARGAEVRVNGSLCERDTILSVGDRLALGHDGAYLFLLRGSGDVERNGGSSGSGGGGGAAGVEADVSVALSDLMALSPRRGPLASPALARAARAECTRGILLRADHPPPAPPIPLSPAPTMTSGGSVSQAEEALLRGVRLARQATALAARWAQDVVFGVDLAMPAPGASVAWDVRIWALLRPGVFSGLGRLRGAGGDGPQEDEDDEEAGGALGAMGGAEVAKLQRAAAEYVVRSSPLHAHVLRDAVVPQAVQLLASAAAAAPPPPPPPPPQSQSQAISPAPPLPARAPLFLASSDDVEAALVGAARLADLCPVLSRRFLAAFQEVGIAVTLPSTLALHHATSPDEDSLPVLPTPLPPPPLDASTAPLEGLWEPPDETSSLKPAPAQPHVHAWSTQVEALVRENARLAQELDRERRARALPAAPRAPHAASEHSPERLLLGGWAADAAQDALLGTPESLDDRLQAISQRFLRRFDIAEQRQ